MPPKGFPITPGTLIQETISLQQELINGLLSSALDRWIGDSNARMSMLTGTFWGRIRWPKSFGKPLTPTLAEGFTIEHKYLFQTWLPTGDGLSEVDKWLSSPEPFKWDAPEETDHFVVGYFAGAASNSNVISVHVADGVRWEYPPGVQPGFKIFDPTSIQFIESAERLNLPDFNISYVPA